MVVRVGRRREGRAPICEVMCVQLPGVPRLVSSSYSAVRMSWMRNDMALSSSRHSWYSAGSESTVLTMFAPEERVRAGVREGAQRRRVHGLDAVCDVSSRCTASASAPSQSLATRPRPSRYSRDFAEMRQR